MTAYVLAQLSIHDRPRYDRYAARFMATLKPFGGRVLAADEAPQVVEGVWPYGKAVLLEFPEAGAALAWAASDGYRAIAADRLAAAHGPVLLLQGYG